MGEEASSWVHGSAEMHLPEIKTCSTHVEFTFTEKQGVCRTEWSEFIVLSHCAPRWCRDYKNCSVLRPAKGECWLKWESWWSRDNWEVCSRDVLLVLDSWLHWRMCIFYEGEEKKTCLSWREMSQQVQISEVLLSGAAGFLRRSSLPLQCQTSLGIITWPWQLYN